MSKTMKWMIIVLVLVVIAIVVWWVAMYNTRSAYQPDDSVNATTTTTNTTTTKTGSKTSTVPVTLDQIKRDVANMDIQFQAGMTAFANLGAAPTQAKILAVAVKFKTASLFINSLTVELEAAITNSKMTTLTAPLSDIGNKLSNSTSNVGAILSNIANISPNTTTSNNSVLSQALEQLKLAQKSLQSARNDVTTIVSGLK